MSVAAVMLVKDEADIIGYTIEYLLGQVDHVYVQDNASTDGTTEIVSMFVNDGVTLIHDDEVGYWQSRKTTELAHRARDNGHAWVVPVDADELWHANDLRTIREFLNGVAPDVQIVSAQLYNHLPTASDLPYECVTCMGTGSIGYGPCPACKATGGEPNPFVRIGWRKREHGALPKVCARTRPDLVIEAGNHSATTDGTALVSGGLSVRHYSWRSPAQYVKKIRNGEVAYKATSLPEDVGVHWRMWSGQPDEALEDHFRQWFWSPDPVADDSLIFDPAPGVPSAT